MVIRLKHVLGLVLILAMVAAVFGMAQEPATAQSETTLVVWDNWTRDAEQAMIEQLDQEFEDAHPGVTISREAYDTSDLDVHSFADAYAPSYRHADAHTDGDPHTHSHAPCDHHRGTGTGPPREQLLPAPDRHRPRTRAHERMGTRAGDRQTAAGCEW